MAAWKTMSRTGNGFQSDHIRACEPFRNGVLKFRLRDPFECLLPSGAKGQDTVGKEVSYGKVSLIKKKKKPKKIPNSHSPSLSIRKTGPCPLIRRDNKVCR